MSLSAEQIQNNYNIFIDNINKYISSPRKEQLLKLYKNIEDILILAPASSKEHYHNAFPGGYVDHVNRVVDSTLKIHNAWKEIGMVETYTIEELVFSAINHDLGKLGTNDEPMYIPNDSDWHVKNQGAIYKTNYKIPFFLIPDKSIFVLISNNIEISENEFLGIKLHDGMYEETNKPYLMSFNPESRLRTSLPLVLHQGDLLASRVEWETHYLHKIGKPKVNTNTQKKQTNTYSKHNPTQQAYQNVSNSKPGLMELFKAI